jgi:hypothetical protein
MLGSGDGSTGGAGSSVVGSSCGSVPLAAPAANVTIVTNIKTSPMTPKRRHVLIFILLPPFLFGSRDKRVIHHAVVIEVVV